MPIRETGSILVPAPRDRVFALLASQLAREPGLRSVPAERLETARGAFVLRDAPGGATRVVHARTGGGFAFVPKPREDLRAEVESELFRIQKMVEALGAP